MVDHLTHWVDAKPTTTATAQVVSKALLEQIIPQYGMVKKLSLVEEYIHLLGATSGLEIIHPLAPAKLLESRENESDNKSYPNQINARN